MIARDAWAIVDADGGCVAVHLGEQNISNALLERRGFQVVPVRILAPGELDRETLERCAQHLEGRPSFGDGKWAARHIRSLAAKEGQRE